MMQPFPLAALRVRAGMTLESAADHLGIARQTLSRYEADSRTAPVWFLQAAGHLYYFPWTDIYLGKASDLAKGIRDSRMKAPAPTTTEKDTP